MSDKRRTKTKKKTAQLSTGLRAADDKARVAPNAVKRGPTAEPVVLPDEEDVKDKPLPPSPAPLNIESDAISLEGNSAQVSFFITKSQKIQLRELGFSEDQIAKMKPAEAHSILGLT
jgi:hypothetical protein